jgi:hypothetical protein
MIIYIPKSPVSQYLVLNLRQLGFSRFESNVLTMPSDFLRVITVLTLTRSSGHFKEKAFHCTIPTFIELPLFTTLLLLPPHEYAWVRFAILTMIIGSPSSHPIMVSWISCNSFDPKKRGIAVALFGTIHEIGSAAAARKWMFNIEADHQANLNNQKSTEMEISRTTTLATRSLYRYVRHL